MSSPSTTATTPATATTTPPSQAQTIWGQLVAKVDTHIGKNHPFERASWYLIKKVLQSAPCVAEVEALMTEIGVVLQPPAAPATPPAAPATPPPAPTTPPPAPATPPPAAE